MDMDALLYKAAKEGHFDTLNQYECHKLEVHFSPNNNTILHVAAQFGCAEFVTKILEGCPSLACHRPNIIGDSAFHVAVRQGYTSLAHAILECTKRLDRELESGVTVTKELLRATNQVGDTALHMAMRIGSDVVKMVKLLIQEDLEFQYPPNNALETPLYIAAERGLVKVMEECLKNCTSLAVGGPCGRTVLHGAVIGTNSRLGKKSECTKLLLEADHKYGIDLIKVKDAYGWTALHYAARNGHSDIAASLLEVDKSAAYIGTENDNNTPLHLAAAAGKVDVISKLLFFSPACCEIVNKKGQNVLHVAMDMEQQDVIECIRKLSIWRLLLNQKDNDGNTPFHLLAKKGNIKRQLTDKLPIGDEVFNNENLTPWQLQLGEDEPLSRLQKSDISSSEKEKLTTQLN
ncbi:hypothetical protein NMG60_11025439 [Bertholletia excelsa]